MVKIEKGLEFRPQQSQAERVAKQDENLRQAAKMYEQHFMSEMVKAMRAATPESGLVETSFGEKLYREQLDQQYINNWADQGGVGLADMIYSHIKERYFPNEQNISPPKGPIAIDKNQILPLEKKNLNLKIESTEIKQSSPGTPGQSEVKIRVQSEPGHEVGLITPWNGQIYESFTNDKGLSRIKIKHDHGLVSDFLFKGKIAKLNSGDQIESGATIGQVFGPESTLHWKMSLEDIDTTRRQNIVG